MISLVGDICFGAAVLLQLLPGLSVVNAVKSIRSTAIGDLVCCAVGVRKAPEGLSSVLFFGVLCEFETLDIISSLPALRVWRGGPK